MKHADLSLDAYVAQFDGREYDRHMHSHPAGLNAAFVDASVHLLDRNTDQETIRDLADRDVTPLDD